MSRYLLETKILSEITKPSPSESLVSWIAEQADEDLFIASRTLAEIRRGVLEKPAGCKREQLEAWFDGPDGPSALFAGRILPFDEKAGLVWASLMAEGAAGGQPRSALDTIIAAVAEVNGCVVVTANERDFAGSEIVNPLRAEPATHPRETDRRLAARAALATDDGWPLGGRRHPGARLARRSPIGGGASLNATAAFGQPFGGVRQSAVRERPRYRSWKNRCRQTAGGRNAPWPLHRRSSLQS